MVTLSGWQGSSTIGSTDACMLEMFGGVVSGGIVGAAVGGIVEVGLGGGCVNVGDKVGKDAVVDVGASVASAVCDDDGDGDGDDVSSG